MDLSLQTRLMERLEEKEAMPALYKKIGERFGALDAWSLYMITSYEEAEKDIGRRADKNRKIYNGMMKTYYYQFAGPKPPKRHRQSRWIGTAKLNRKRC